jgi:hypothetical protein
MSRGGYGPAVRATNPWSRTHHACNASTCLVTGPPAPGCSDVKLETRAKSGVLQVLSGPSRLYRVSSRRHRCSTRWSPPSAPRGPAVTATRWPGLQSASTAACATSLSGPAASAAPRSELGRDRHDGGDRQQPPRQRRQSGLRRTGAVGRARGLRRRASRQGPGGDLRGPTGARQWTDREGNSAWRSRSRASSPSTAPSRAAPATRARPRRSPSEGAAAATRRQAGRRTAR